MISFSATRGSRWRIAAPGLLLVVLLAGCSGSGPEQGENKAPSAPAPEIVSEIDGKAMVLVPAGEFLLGTDMKDPDNTHLKIGTVKPLFVDQGPQQKLNLPAFYIDKFEVTNREYQRFLKATRYHDRPTHWEGEEFPEGMGDRPVTNVSWGEAMAYALWAEKILPTEEQWEKAARGTDGRLFPWGNEYQKGISNIGLEGKKDSANVGAFPKDISPYGAFDMGGNVMEWTLSWYLPYKGSDYRNKKMGGRLKVMRGNGFQKGGHYFLDAYRYVFHRTEADPDEFYENVGFRCVFSLKNHSNIN